MNITTRKAVVLVTLNGDFCSESLQHLLEDRKAEKAMFRGLVAGTSGYMLTVSQ
jgi:hypothetical protein